MRHPVVLPSPAALSSTVPLSGQRAMSYSWAIHLKTILLGAFA